MPNPKQTTKRKKPTLTRIDFKGTTTSLGRNGYFLTTGLEVFNLAKLTITDNSGKKYKPRMPEVELTGITSKGAPARGHVTIPHSAIPEVIKALQACLQTKPCRKNHKR